VENAAVLNSLVSRIKCGSQLIKCRHFPTV
jgi:hypothetical protein